MRTFIDTCFDSLPDNPVTTSILEYLDHHFSLPAMAGFSFTWLQLLGNAEWSFLCLLGAADLGGSLLGHLHQGRPSSGSASCLSLIRTHIQMFFRLLKVRKEDCLDVTKQKQTKCFYVMCRLQTDHSDKRNLQQ